MRLAPVFVLFLLAGFVAAKPILIIVDASGSMAGTKIDDAKQAAIGVVNSANDEIALMVYTDCDSGGDPSSGSISVWQGFTTDKQALIGKIQQITSESSTPIANAITEGAAYIQSAKGSGAIVLLTDGEETCGGDPVQAATDARAQGVDVINVVGFQLDQSAQTQMQSVSSAGGGRYYNASDASQLNQALQQAYQTAGGGGSGFSCCGAAAVLVGLAGFVLSRKE